MTLSLVDRPLHFEALGDGPGGVWQPPRQFRFLDRVGTVPLSDSELLQTSLYLPLAVQESAGTHEVVGVVHPEFLARPLVRADGRWGQFYMPIALRCLPFRRAGRVKGGGVTKLEIATDLGVDDDAAVTPLFAGNGRLHQDLAAVVSLLDRLEKGKARLASAAASLAAADLLVPLTSTNAANALAIDVKLLVIDPRRLRRLTPARTVALAADGILPLDLATACVFSSRLWASNLAPAPSTDDDAQIAIVDPALFGQRAQGTFAIELRIDDSSLFSFDTFAKSGTPPVEPGC
jgi:hypothetical protein